MKGEAKRLLEYMEEEEKRFHIPPYQRNYDWNDDNCKQLLDDLLEVIKKKDRPSHFLGSIIRVPDEKSGETIIIDGQQRIITVTLLLLAMHNFKDTEKGLKNSIRDKYLVTKYDHQGTVKPKLKSQKNDQEALENLFAGAEGKYIEKSNITENYKYFSNWIQENIKKKKITIEQLFEAIGKLIIIDIDLNPGDKPQLVFESINSTGRPLTEGDKIRNFILMDLDIDKQEAYYKEYWQLIENYTKKDSASKYDVTPFIRDYLSLKKKGSIDQKKVYKLFKNYAVADNEENKKNLLKDLRNYAEQYEFLINGETKLFEAPKELKNCIIRLNYLGISEVRPFFLEVLMLCKNKKLKIDQVTEIFEIIENYLLRKFICDGSISGITRMFTGLHKEIIGYDQTTDNYVEKLKYTLISGEYCAPFPEDEDFSLKFTERQTYSTNKSGMYILERLENYERKKTYNTGGDEFDFYSDGAAERYTVEHIMPQSIKKWEEDLQKNGDDPEEVHNKWLHRVANLTLLTVEDNSDAGNKSFAYKVKKYTESGLYMNSYIVEIGTKEKGFTWTSKELEKRSEYLKEIALNIWPRYKKTEYKPQPKNFDERKLSYGEDHLGYFYGRVLRGVEFRNREQWDVPKGYKPNAGWKEMAQKVIEHLYKENSGIISYLAESADKGLASKFYKGNQDGMKINRILKTEFYVSIPGSNETKILMLQELFDKYGISTDDLIFKLEPLNNFAKDRK